MRLRTHSIHVVGHDICDEIGRLHFLANRRSPESSFRQLVDDVFTAIVSERMIVDSVVW